MSFCPFTAIKVNCVGSCGISSKLNDASWMLEEKYLSSTLSVADKGKGANFHSPSLSVQLSFSSEILNIISQISFKWPLMAPLYNKNLAHFEGLQCLLLKFILFNQLFVSEEFPVLSTCLSGFFLSV